MALTPLARYRASATEADLLKAFRDLARVRSGAFFHIRDARGQETEGLTDVVLIVPPVLALLEVKTQYDRLSPRQIQVLDLLVGCTTLVSGVVRPVPKPGELSLDDALFLIDGPYEEAS